MRIRIRNDQCKSSRNTALRLAASQRTRNALPRDDYTPLFRSVFLLAECLWAGRSGEVEEMHLRRACGCVGTYLGRVARRNRRRVWGAGVGADVGEGEGAFRLRRKQGLLILRSLQRCAILNVFNWYYVGGGTRP